MDEQIRSRLEALERRFEVVEDDFEDFEPEIMTAPNMDEHQYHAFLDRRARTPYGSVFAELRAFAISELIPSYLRASTSEREELVTAITKLPAVRSELWQLMREYRWRLQKAPAEEREELLRSVLRLALFVEIDMFESAGILTGAWRDAEEAGLDPAEYFAEAADLAVGMIVDSRLMHSQSPRELLRDFEPLDQGRPGP